MQNYFPRTVIAAAIAYSLGIGNVAHAQMIPEKERAAMQLYARTKREMDRRGNDNGILEPSEIVKGVRSMGLDSIVINPGEDAFFYPYFKEPETIIHEKKIS